MRTEGGIKIRELPSAHGKSMQWWAWQFLRRNPEYVADWREGVERYSFALRQHELNPSIHPHPHPLAGFAARRGQRLLSPDDLEFRLARGGSLRKWGLGAYLNPENESPRSIVTEFFAVIGQGDNSEFFGEEREAELATFTFDLSRPLKEQLKLAHIELSNQQNSMREAGGLKVKRVRRQSDNWLHYLNVLDKRAAGYSWRHMMAEFCPIELEAGIEPGNSSVRKDYLAAMKLVGGGYLDLATMPMVI